MRRIIFFTIGLSIVILAKTVQVNITADKFWASQNQNITKFNGHVKMTKGDDFLFCNNLTINTMKEKDTNKTIPKEYISEGNVSYSFSNPKTTFKGRGDKVIYYPLEGKYIVLGNGYLEDTASGRILKGDKIYLDNTNGDDHIEGKKNKPVQFTFTIEEKTKDTNATH